MSTESGKKSKFLGGDNSSQKRGQRMLNDQNLTTLSNKTMDCRRKSRRWREVSETLIIQENQSQTCSSNDQNGMSTNSGKRKLRRVSESDLANMSMDCRRKSRRWREASKPVLIEKNPTSESNDENGDASNYCGQGSRNDQQNSDVLPHENSDAYSTYMIGLIVKYEDSGDNVCNCTYCGAYFWHEEAIKQSSINAQLIYTNCCKKGQIKLPQPRPTPNFLRTLLNDKNFKENIRVYNSMFCFTSMGAKIDHKINTGSGPYIFKINGQVHHLMGSVLPFEGESPKYAQLYVYDTRNEIANRINAIDPALVNQNIRSDIVEGLIKMFDEINELAKQFRIMRDKFENRSLPSFKMSILDRRSIDDKQYEKPVNDEIGGLIVGDIGEYNSNKDIIIESNSGSLQRVSKIHPKYMSLQYPILFPYGEDGYTPDLQMEQIGKNRAQKREKMSMRSYIAYQIQDRNYETNTLLQGGRLFQQFLVDSYATVEEYRLDWIRKKKKKS
ncbi:uncharacterized protein LOC133721639 isoform X2 [Rosa rugosa]|uniref:uncharacterized protein LOC133721639 isoform X2 n=1 Tax=Rosa rugosa TaxID=74645 RepID=UPI002B40FF47|nr:uncharacterized protein LOC133721639 isoform X2 [Rosa rugosa]